MDVIRLYHGTSSNRAAKIVKNGFRQKPDLIFFAEDFATAEFFAVALKLNNNETQPLSFTVLIFDIPHQLAARLGLLNRSLIGAFNEERFIQPGDSCYERLLIGQENIFLFNRYLRCRAIEVKRWKLT